MIQRAVRCTSFLAILAVSAAVLASCAAPTASDDTHQACELEPQRVSQALSDDESVGSTQEALSSYSCKMSGATGYKSGSAFDIKVVSVDGKEVEWKTANAYMAMAEAAAKDGVQIRVVSGFRTMAEQQYLYNCYKTCSCNSCNLAAVPGTSNHQSGHALDLNTSSGGVYSWLANHAAKYGFKRTVPSEAWHWEWWGTDDGTGPCNADTLKAKLTKRWSNAKRYHGKKADYIACAGDDVKLSFTFANKGSAPWRDVKGRGKEMGSDVFLVTANGKKDAISGHTRFSVKQDKNAYVRGDHKAKNCSSKDGCRRTTFISGGIEGKAPKKPGLYKSRWRLRDYSKLWGKNSKGFGPKVEVDLKVVSCELPKQSCGCRVWCSDGSSHNIAAGAADSDASCKSIGSTVCLPAKYLSHSFEACAATPPTPPTPPTATTTANAPEPPAVEPPAAPSDTTDPSASNDPNAPVAADPTDEGAEDDANSQTPADDGVDDGVGIEEPDDADFTDDGYPGYDDKTDSTPSSSGGCSIAAPGASSTGTISLSLVLLGIAGVFAARRRRRNYRALGLLPIVGLGFFAVGGCAGGGDQGEGAHAGYDLGTAEEALTLKCGADKYSSVQGADVSTWQGSFNWSAERKSGMDFGYARISDGLNYIDNTFETNWSKMKSAGVLRGAYQFFEPGQSATAQAEMMVKKVGKLGSGDLPCVIDVETTGGQSPGTIASKVKTWLDIVEKGTGKKPIIYTGAYFWQDSVKSTSFGGYDLWIAAYGPSCPSIPNGWKNWTFWQYCDGQKQYCKNGDGFDRNVFNGSKEELLKLSAGDKTLKAKAVKKWSNAHRYHGKNAEYIACAGDKVKMSFTFKNVGSAIWRDVDGRGDSVGSDVFLVSANGKKDKLTGHTRFSLRLNKNRHVHGDHKAKNCSNENGCRKTTFVAGGIEGVAPKKPGIYHSRWRLRDYSKEWGKHSHGFGPKVDLSLKVVSCELPPKQDCGCRVWCNDGTSHNIAAGAADSDASCKSIGETVCLPAKYLDHDFQACAAPTQPPTPEPQPPSGTAGSGGQDTGSGGSAGTGDPNANASSGAAGAAGAAGGDSTDPPVDPGDENDPNAYPIVDAEDDSQVEDDPDYTDDGFNGDDKGGTDPAANSGCSVASIGQGGSAPLGIGGLGVFIALAEIRRRRRNARRQPS